MRSISIAAVCASIAGTAGGPVALSAQARVQGTVYDSLAREPLVGATVRVVAADDRTRGFTAVSGARGEFVLDTLPLGTWLATFFHRRLDSLGLAAPVLRVDVATSAPIRLHLATPETDSYINTTCGFPVAADSAGLFSGRVVSSADGAGIADAVVIGEWPEFALINRQFTRAERRVQARTSPTGHFHLCGVPTQTLVNVRAASGADTSGVIQLELPETGYVFRPLMVGPAVNEVFEVRDDSGRVVEVRSRLKGAATLTSRVTLSTGAPAERATVRILGTSSQAETQRDGSFVLNNLPEGSHTLEARLIGFQPVRTVVDLRAGPNVAAPLAFGAKAIALDTVRVISSRTRNDGDYQRWVRRRNLGGGTFISRDDIIARVPVNATDLLFGQPNFNVRPSSFGNVVTVTGRARICYPDYYLDGFRVRGDVDNLVLPENIVSMEVYGRATNIPSEFLSVDGCAAVIIWTTERWPELAAPQVGKQQPPRR